jgi:hypothetical protein
VPGGWGQGEGLEERVRICRACRMRHWPSYHLVYGMENIWMWRCARSIAFLFIEQLTTLSLSKVIKRLIQFSVPLCFVSLCYCPYTNSLLPHGQPLKLLISSITPNLPNLMLRNRLLHSSTNCTLASAHPSNNVTAPPSPRKHFLYFSTERSHRSFFGFEDLAL